MGGKFQQNRLCWFFLGKREYLAFLPGGKKGIETGVNPLGYSKIKIKDLLYGVRLSKVESRILWDLLLVIEVSTTKKTPGTLIPPQRRKNFSKSPA